MDVDRLERELHDLGRALDAPPHDPAPLADRIMSHLATNDITQTRHGGTKARATVYVRRPCPGVKGAAPMRSIVRTALTALATVLALAPGPGVAPAGGPTSVLIVNPTTGATASL